MRALVNSEQGLTLVEVIIAAAIITVGLAGVSAALQVAAHGVQEGRQLSTATFLANERLEQVRTTRWEAGPPAIDALGISPTSSAAPTTFPDEAARDGSYVAYARTVRIVDCGVGAGCAGVVAADLRQVIVTVSYRPMTGVGLAASGITKAAAVTIYVTQR